jgi:AraC-like DNA-binding protein
VILGVTGRTALRHAAGGRPKTERLLFLTLLSGEASFRAWDERLRPVACGDVLAIDSALPVEVRAEAGARLAGVVLPLHVISPRFVTRERLRAGALRAHAGGLADLLHQLLGGVADGPVTPGDGALADAIGGLASAMLEDCWAQDGAGSPAASAVRLDQVAQHLRRHFADPNLTAGAVAEALGISRRYLHKLYTQAGRSFRHELIGLRIDSCLKALSDDRVGRKTIAEIALAAGYADISQFNRHFRRLKGATPTAVRRTLRAARGPRLRRTLASAKLA